MTTLKKIRAELSAMQTPSPRTAKRRPPEDVVRRYNQSGYSDSSIVFLIPWFQDSGADSWTCVPVHSLGDDSFEATTGGGRIVFREDELKPDADGKIVIDIRGLTHPMSTDHSAMEEFEFPPEILEKRKESRKIKALEKDAVFVDRQLNPMMYFYTEGDQLRILHGEKEIVADVELIHGRPAVNVEALEIGKSYLELPEEVASKYKRVLDERRLQKASLVPVGENVFNGKVYFRLSQSIPTAYWNAVDSYFEFFDGGEGDLDGWLTCYPGNVAETLGIKIIQ
jgi:hypothetical protein